MEIEQFSFKRSERGYREQLQECAEIIGNSIVLVGEGKKSFRKVIASQLRLLLCDKENSLLPKCDKNIKLAPVSNNYLLNDEDQQMLNYTMLFNREGIYLELDDWLDQVVMRLRNSFTIPKKVKCKKCQDETDVESKHEEMKLCINDKVLIQYNCHCGKRNNVDVSDEIEQDDKETNFIFYKINEHTIRSIIRTYADRNGGAHVDKSIPYVNFADIHLGRRYIDAIANYILGAITYSKK
ncbi:hypothetical protein [Priestia megaterium]